MLGGNLESLLYGDVSVMVTRLTYDQCLAALEQVEGVPGPLQRSRGVVPCSLEVSFSPWFAVISLCCCQSVHV